MCSKVFCAIGPLTDGRVLSNLWETIIIVIIENRAVGLQQSGDR